MYAWRSLVPINRNGIPGAMKPSLTYSLWLLRLKVQAPFFLRIAARQLRALSEAVPPTDGADCRPDCGASVLASHPPAGARASFALGSGAFSLNSVSALVAAANPFESNLAATSSRFFPASASPCREAKENHSQDCSRS